MTRVLSIAAVLLVLGIGLYGCDNDTSTELPDNGPVIIGEMTCLDCHSSEDMLKANLSEKSVDLVKKAKDDG